MRAISDILTGDSLERVLAAPATDESANTRTSLSPVSTPLPAEVCVWCDGSGATWGRDETGFVLTACTCQLGARFHGLGWREIEALKRLAILLDRPAWAQFRASKLHDVETETRQRVVAALDARRGLWLFGLPGRGKSYLGVASLRELARRGHKPGLMSVPGWLAEMRRAYGQEKPEEDAEDIALTPSIWPALLMDDLGAQRVTDWASEKVYNLVEARWQAAAIGRITIVTSNQAPAELEAQFHDRLQGARIVSRLLGMCDLIELVGVDRRLDRAVTP